MYFNTFGGGAAEIKSEFIGTKCREILLKHVKANIPN